MPIFEVSQEASVLIWSIELHRFETFGWEKEGSLIGLPAQENYHTQTIEMQTVWQLYKGRDWQPCTLGQNHGKHNYRHDHLSYDWMISASRSMRRCHVASA